MNSKQKNILLFVSVFFFCGVLGSGVWFWWKQYQLAKVREVTEKALKAFPILMADPERGWKNRPNGEMFSGETFPLRESPPFRMNSDESQILITEPSGGVAFEKTLWIIGDSSPFGLGANAEKTFASRLAKTLAPHRVSVRNFSVIGYDSSQMKKYLEILEQRNSSKPDLLILWAGFNDVSKFIHKFFWARPILESVGFQQYKTNVTAILNHMKERDVPVIQVTIPVLEAYPELDRINDWIRNRDNSQFDVSVFDIKKLFLAKSDSALYSPFDRSLPYRFHPSNLGHELIFRELLPLVIRKLNVSLESHRVRTVVAQP